MRRFHGGVGNDQQTGAALLFDGGQRTALLVQQIGSDRQRDDSADFGALLLVGLFLQHTQNLQAQGFDVANTALAAAAWAYHGVGFFQRRAQALTGHFQQAEA